MYEIAYEATIEQLRLLIENSGSCYQNISFDCYQMALKLTSAWWHDFKNRDVDFFDGTNAKVRQCSKGKCNCDGTSEWKRDEGKITADWLLPITGFSSYADLVSDNIGQFDPFVNRSS